MTKIRFTAYSGVYPVGHGETEAEALAEAKRRLRRGQRVTKIVKRLRAYPFTTFETRHV